MKQSDIDRFWSRVDRTEGCWLWVGQVNNQGYGRLDLFKDGRRLRFLAHRLSLVVAGTPASPDAVVLHSCDVPRCVNPSHLSIGTQKANMLDAASKGRIDTAGLFADFAKPCRECGVEFTGPPNRRYCDEHRYSSAVASRRWRERQKLLKERAA